MAPVSSNTSILANPLATAAQLSTSGSQYDGVPSDLETSAIHIGARLTQVAGILLRLPQETIAKAVILFTRFWIGSEGGSLKDYDIKDISAASLYVVTKSSTHQKLPRTIINVYGYLESVGTVFFVQDDLDGNHPQSYYVSEGKYFAEKPRLFAAETALLRVLGFQTHVSLPYSLCINYLQALGVFEEKDGTEVAKRAHAHLNSALLNPQLLCLTQQPSSLATAAIYLAAKEVGVKLSAEQWWEVFDTDREVLGFIVVALVSMEGFVKKEKSFWKGKRMPTTAAILEQEIKSSTAS